MVETAEIRQLPHQRLLAGMAERRVAQIMRERDRLREVLVQLERARQIVRAICATSRLWVRRVR